MMRRAQARETLRSLATGIREPSEEEAVARLLERVAKAEPEVTAILLEVGAEAALLRAEVAASIDGNRLEAAGMGRTRRGVA